MVKTLFPTLEDAGMPCFDEFNHFNVPPIPPYYSQVIVQVYLKMALSNWVAFKDIIM